MKKIKIKVVVWSLPAFAIMLLLGNPDINAQNIAVTDSNEYVADQSAMLDVQSNEKGMLVPRMDSSQRVGISSPATGLLVFDTDANGFFYYNGTDWMSLSTQVVSPASAGANDPLFSVVNTSGDTVFAVYPEAVSIQVGSGAGKGNRGGFAVGGLSSGNKLGNLNFLTVSPDSVRIYVDTADNKSNRGGFAVGGLSSTGKNIGVDYLTISDDSVRVYIDTTSTSKSNRGGFAVGGLSSTGKSTKQQFLQITSDSTRIYVNDSTAGFAVGSIESGSVQSFLNLTSQNYFIGHEAGRKTSPDPDPGLTYGKFNQFFGYYAGYNNTTGRWNSFNGYQAGYHNTEGYQNYFAGYQAGYSNTSQNKNVAIGPFAGYANNGGQLNVFLGASAGRYGTNLEASVFVGTAAGMDNNQYYNTFVGYQAGMHNASGQRHTFLGIEAGRWSEGGMYNIFIGRRAGHNASGNYNVYIGANSGGWPSQNDDDDFNTGSNNVFVGYSAGSNFQSGTGNVFVGSSAGAGVSSASGKLYIDNSSTASPLIYGDFTGNSLVFNGSAQVTGTFLDASGDAGTSGQVLSSTGSGTNWIDPAQDDDWTISGNDIYYNTGNVGIGDSSPNSTIQIEGSVATAFEVLSSGITLDDTHRVVACTNGIKVNLPAASTCEGRQYTIKNVESNTVQVIPDGSDEIDGLSSIDLTSQWQYITIVSDGMGQWLILAEN